MEFDELSKRYFGRMAEDYDGRANSALWRREQAAVDAALGTLPAGSSILDVPVGTGRFLESYGRYGLRPTGIDISGDMLAVAAARASALGLPVTLRQGDIRELPLPGGSHDTAVCMRLAHWINSGDLERVVRELARVSRRSVIIGVSHYVPAAELGFPAPGAFLRLANQWIRRAKERAEKLLHRPSTHAHEHARVMTIFHDCELSVRSTRRIKASRGGIDYCIHHLDRR